MPKRLAQRSVFGILAAVLGCVLVIAAMSEIVVTFLINRVFKAFLAMIVDLFS
jgi:hypothetical protein